MINQVFTLCFYGLDLSGRNRMTYGSWQFSLVGTNYYWLWTIWLVIFLNWNKRWCWTKLGEGLALQGWKNHLSLEIMVWRSLDIKIQFFMESKFLEFHFFPWFQFDFMLLFIFIVISLFWCNCCMHDIIVVGLCKVVRIKV